MNIKSASVHAHDIILPKHHVCVYVVANTNKYEFLFIFTPVVLFRCQTIKSVAASEVASASCNIERTFSIENGTDGAVCAWLWLTRSFIRSLLWPKVINENVKTDCLFSKVESI